MDTDDRLRAPRMLLLVTMLAIPAFGLLLSTGAVCVATALAYGVIDTAQIELAPLLAALTTAVAGVGMVTMTRVRMEHALRESRAELEQRVKERTQALRAEVEERRKAELDALRANMSHELRTPLNAIVGYAELVRDELVETEQGELAADLDKALSSAAHLVRMISDVLDLSRIEAGQLDVTLQEVDVQALLAELARLVEPERARSRCALELEVAQGLALRTDPVRLSQISLNLSTNALKFTEAGRVVARASVERGVFRLSVDDSPTRRRDGSGLGLALSRDLAERLGGTLWATSTPGSGSTFTLELLAR